MARASRSAHGPGVLMVAATGLAAGAVALDAGFNLPVGLRAVLFAAWAAAVGVLAWGTLGRSAARTREAWAAGGTAVAVFGLLVLYVPGGARASRLTPPWTASPPTVRLTVTTGDPVVARGTSVTVACVRDRLATDDSPVWLELRDEAGEVRVVEPTEPVPGVLMARVPGVASPLAYRFAGYHATTPWHRIVPAHPVSLMPASRLTASPPDYAVGQFAVRHFPASEPAVCLKGGRVVAQFEFDRPTAEARAWWRGDDDEPDQPVRLELAADSRSATVTMPVPSTGQLVLRLTGDHGLATEHLFPVRGVADHPPRFVSVAGFEAGLWAVRPDEALDLRIEVEDDFWAVAPVAELLFGPTPDEAVTAPIPLTASGSGVFSGRLRRALAGPVQSGRMVARLRVRDQSHPSGVLFPESGWVVLTRSETAPPLAEQIVVAQRDRVAALLRTASDSDRPTAEAIQATARSLRHVAELDVVADELHDLASTPVTEFASRVTAVLELNRNVSVERLDRLRLRSLATATGQLAAGEPNAADQTRLRDRLAAVIATSPRLTAARVASDERVLAGAVQAAGTLSEEMDAAAARLIEARVEQLRPLAVRLADLTGRLETAEAGWGLAARLIGSDRPAATHVRRAARLIADARTTDTLTALATAGRHLAEQSTAFGQAAEARGDPREAARQLVRWRTDLDARPGPPPAAELVAWHACARELATLARRHNPSGGDTPDRIAQEFPSPAELKRRVARDLREWLTVADPGRATDELKVLAERLDTVPPPAEGRRSRLAAAAVRRVVTDRSAGRTADAAASLAEVRWRLELLAQDLAGDGDPVAVLNDPPSQRTTDRLAALAVRIGVPPEVGDKPDRLNAAVRARLDGTDTDRRRVGDLLRWWSSRPVIDGSHVRDLLALLDSIRLGEATAAAEVRRLARANHRPVEFKTEVAVILGRLRDALGGAADRSLASAADLDRPTAAQRLIDFDTGGRLADRRLAADASRLAEEVGAVARDVAVASAAVHADPRLSEVRNQFTPRLARIEAVFSQPGVPDDLKARWKLARQSWDRAGDLTDTLRQTAAALRLAMTAYRKRPGTSSVELALGQRLGEAERLLTVNGNVQPVELKARLLTASRVIEQAAE